MSFDELLPYPLGSFTYRNEQVRAVQVQRVIVYKLVYCNFLYICIVHTAVLFQSLVDVYRRTQHVKY
jgi:hypothetical protein